MSTLKNVTKPTESTTKKHFYDNCSSTASPTLVPHTYKHLATNYRAAQHILRHHSNHIYDEAGELQTLDALINGQQKYLWTQSMSNELGR